MLATQHDDEILFLHTLEEANGMPIYRETTLEEWEENDGVFLYECPCGDLFFITAANLKAGYRVIECPSCSLKIRINL